MIKYRVRYPIGRPAKELINRQEPWEIGGSITGSGGRAIDELTLP